MPFTLRGGAAYYACDWPDLQQRASCTLVATREVIDETGRKVRYCERHHRWFHQWVDAVKRGMPRKALLRWCSWDWVGFKIPEDTR